MTVTGCTAEDSIFEKPDEHLLIPVPCLGQRTRVFLITSDMVTRARVLAELIN